MMHLYWFWRTKRGKDGDYSINSYKVGETESENKNGREILEVNCEIGEITKEECVQWR